LKLLRISIDLKTDWLVLKRIIFGPCLLKICSSRKSTKILSLLLMITFKWCRVCSTFTTNMLIYSKNKKKYRNLLLNPTTPSNCINNKYKTINHCIRRSIIWSLSMYAWIWSKSTDLKSNKNYSKPVNN